MPTNFSTPARRASSISCAPIIRLSKNSWPGFSRLNPMPPTLAARWITISTFLTARRQFSRSTRFRVFERGTTMSRAPAASSWATTRDPRKPAPPGTSTRRPVQKLIESDYFRDARGVCSPEMRILYDDSLARNPAGTGTFVRGLRGGLQARNDIELVTARSSLDGASDLDVPGKGLGRRLGRAGAHLRHYLVDLPGQARAQRCDAIFCPTSPLRLVLAGSAGWLYQPVLDAISELGLASRVVRLGNVDPGTIKWLYQHAAALLFPSLYEGFGLPVLEAFSLGCPVVAARIGSVVEIADGDSALLLDPTHVAAWAAALDRIEAGDLPPGMVEAARQRARRFSWAGCADAVVTLVRSAHVD